MKGSRPSKQSEIFVILGVCVFAIAIGTFQLKTRGDLSSSKASGSAVGCGGPTGASSFSSRSSALTAASSFRILKGQDLSGANLRDQITPDLKGCWDACAADSQCKAFTFDTQTKRCYLKSKTGGNLQKSVATSGVKCEGDSCANLASPAALTPSKCPLSHPYPYGLGTYCCKTHPINRKYITHVSGRSPEYDFDNCPNSGFTPCPSGDCGRTLPETGFRVLEGQSLSGASYRNEARSDWSSCRDLCSQEARCQAFHFDGTRCHLKETHGQSSSSSGSFSGIKCLGNACGKLASAVVEERDVLLQYAANKKYLKGPSSASATLAFHSSQPTQAEIFRMTLYSNGVATFKARSNGLYLVDPGDQSSPLKADGSSVVEGAKFRIFEQIDGSFGIQSAASGKYWYPNGAGEPIARSGQVRDGEKILLKGLYEVASAEKKIVLQTQHGTFISARTATEEKLHSKPSPPDPHLVFTQLTFADGSVALRSEPKGGYVCVSSDGSYADAMGASAEPASCRFWTKAWTLGISFQAISSGTYLYDVIEGTLQANVSTVGNRSIFKVVEQTDPWSLVTSADVVIQYASSHKFLRASKTTEPVKLDASYPHAHEVFRMFVFKDGSVAFKSRQTERFVRSSSSTTRADAAGLGDCERYTISKQSDGTQAIYSRCVGKYWYPNGAEPIARAGAVAQGEKFRIISVADIAYIQSYRSGLFVSSAPDTNPSKVIEPNRKTPAGWEKFVIVRHADQTVSFRSLSSHRYLGDYAPQIRPMGAVAGSYERFRLVEPSQNQDGRVAIQSVRTGKYWYDGLNQRVEATASTIGDGELFRLIPIYDLKKVALLSVRTGKYLRNNPDHSLALTASAPKPFDQESFYLIKFGHLYALLSAYNNKYVQHVGGVLKGNSAALFENALFKLVTHSDGKFSLQDPHSGQYWRVTWSQQNTLGEVKMSATLGMPEHLKFGLPLELPPPPPSGTAPAQDICVYIPIKICVPGNAKALVEGAIRSVYNAGEAINQGPSAFFQAAEKAAKDIGTLAESLYLVNVDSVNQGFQTLGQELDKTLNVAASLVTNIEPAIKKLVFKVLFKIKEAVGLSKHIKQTIVATANDPARFKQVLKGLRAPGKLDKILKGANDLGGLTKGLFDHTKDRLKHLFKDPYNLSLLNDLGSSHNQARNLKISSPTTSIPQPSPSKFAKASKKALSGAVELIAELGPTIAGTYGMTYYTCSVTEKRDPKQDLAGYNACLRREFEKNAKVAALDIVFGVVYAGLEQAVLNPMVISLSSLVTLKAAVILPGVGAAAGPVIGFVTKVSAFIALEAGYYQLFPYYEQEVWPKIKDAVMQAAPQETQ